MKAVPVAAFIFQDKNRVNFVSTSVLYRTPRIVKAKDGWYIKYSYKVPEIVRHLFPKAWHPFRIKKDMNRRKGQEREDFANWLLENIKESLKGGYNPFQEAIDEVEAGKLSPDRLVTAEDAFKIFLDTWSKQGLESNTMAKYKKCVNRLGEYLHKTKQLYGDIKNITTADIEAFLEDGKTTYTFSNREYNNTHDFIRTCFIFLAKKGYIDKSPVVDIKKLKVKTSKHKYFDTLALTTIKKALLASDPYTWFVMETVYYLCIRAEKELMNLQVGNINWDQNNILLDAEGVKGGAGEYMPMDKRIKEIFLDRGIDKYPANFYVFGSKGIPAEKTFKPSFFSERFRNVRDAIGLAKEYTIYGMKHTRVIHLKQDGLDDATIMKHTRHKTYEAYAKYLRDLGVDANPEKINAVSRTI